MVPPAPPPTYTLSTKVDHQESVRILYDFYHSFLAKCKRLLLLGDRRHLSLPRLLCLYHWEQLDHLNSRILAHSQKASLQPAPLTGARFLY